MGQLSLDRPARAIPLERADAPLADATSLAAPARGGSVLRCRIGHVYTDEDLLAHDGEEIDKTLPQHLERPLLAAAASGARSRARPDRRPELKVDPAGLEPATSTLPASRSPN